MHHTPATDLEDEPWRLGLLNAAVEGRLAASDHHDLVHRHDTATRPARRLAVRAEIEVLLRCLDAGLEVRTEVQINDGRPTDLVVTLPAHQFAIHVKRLPVVLDAAPPVPEAFSTLADVPRPYLVGVRWLDALPPDDATIEEVRRFLRGARMRDRLPLRRAGAELGLIEVRAPSDDPGGAIRFAPMGIESAATVDRTGRLLRRAYLQFVPGLENTIVLVSGADSSGGGDLVDRAVLGGHVERWDRLPVVGERVAHGRDDGGLWNGRHYERSRLVGFCGLDGRPGRLWERDASDPPAGDIVEALRKTLAGTGSLPATAPGDRT